LGKSPEEILAFLNPFTFHWRHFTLKKAGLIDSESFKAYINIIEDAVIGDLKFYENHRYRYGVWASKILIQTLKFDALLASSAFPGIIS
jgi:NTE family protein